jgi:hypothetical protein
VLGVTTDAVGEVLLTTTDETTGEITGATTEDTTDVATETVGIVDPGIVDPISIVEPAEIGSFVCACTVPNSEVNISALTTKVRLGEGRFRFMSYGARTDASTSTTVSHVQ